MLAASTVKALSDDGYPAVVKGGWLQEDGSQKVIVLRKVGTDANLADALTKGVDAESIRYGCEGVGLELRDDRHSLAPELDGKSGGAEMKLDDGECTPRHTAGRSIVL